MFKPITKRYSPELTDFNKYFKKGELIEVYKEATRISYFKELDTTQEELVFFMHELVKYNYIKLITEPDLPIVKYLVIKD